MKYARERERFTSLHEIINLRLLLFSPKTSIDNIKSLIICHGAKHEIENCIGLSK